MASRRDVPLLERLKFVAIAAGNLDEFFMIRIAGVERNLEDRDDLEARDRLANLARNTGREIARVFGEDVRPELEREGIRFVAPDRLSPSLSERAKSYYERVIHPCLTPIALDPTHPFPVLRSGSLNMAFRVENPGAASRGPPDAESAELTALVQVPSVLPRFVRFPDEECPYRFVALEDIIRLHSSALFPGHVVFEAAPFRLTRASDLDLAEDEADDLLSTVEDELRRRDRGEPIRLEVADSTSWILTARLQELTGLHDRQVERAPTYLGLSQLWSVLDEVDLPQHRDPPFHPALSARASHAPTIFRSISEGDILLHHPYDSYRPVVDFVEQAAADPDVVAIRQTVYRTSGDSPVVRALTRAAEAGKEVTALVELKARFDEANNIAWARALERSGVHVVYGLIGLETHGKMLLVTRREGGTLKRYLHLATGNYNPSTARLFTDFSLFTAEDEITKDALLLFNVLTGYGELPPLRHLIVAPFGLREHFIERLKTEIEHARAGRPSGLVAQVNAVSDPRIVAALYEASRAGVPIDLVVRGVCCLRPGIASVSPTIRVRSIIDRFMEHARIFWWRNGGDDLVYSGSADWMNRNFERRIEVAFPIRDEQAKREIVEEILPRVRSDERRSWQLRSDGTWAPPPEAAARRAQTELLARRSDEHQLKRTGVRPEMPVKRVISPALRVAQAQQRRRRS